MTMFDRPRRSMTVAAAALGLCTSNAIAMDKKPVITADMARSMLDACAQKAQQKGWKMNIAVVDDGANLVAFVRMDGAPLASAYIAQHKAMTAAGFGYATRDVAEWAYGKDQKPGFLPGLATVPGIVAFPGGLPIATADKVLIGGIGVSGDKPDNDEACARSGLDAVKGQLS